jgi:hypothetical protein
MIHLDQDYEKNMVAELEEMGFYPKDAKSAVIDIQKVILLRLSQSVEEAFTDTEKKIFHEMGDQVSEEELLKFMNRYFRDTSPLSRAKAEETINEVWESYLDKMKIIP